MSLSRADLWGSTPQALPGNMQTQGTIQLDPNFRISPNQQMMYVEATKNIIISITNQHQSNSSKYLLTILSMNSWNNPQFHAVATQVVRFVNNASVMGHDATAILETFAVLGLQSDNTIVSDIAALKNAGDGFIQWLNQAFMQPHQVQQAAQYQQTQQMAQPQQQFQPQPQQFVPQQQYQPQQNTGFQQPQQQQLPQTNTVGGVRTNLVDPMDQVSPASQEFDRNRNKVQQQQVQQQYAQQQESQELINLRQQLAQEQQRTAQLQQQVQQPDQWTNQQHIPDEVFSDAAYNAEPSTTFLEEAALTDEELLANAKNDVDGWAIMAVDDGFADDDADLNDITASGKPYRWETYHGVVTHETEIVPISYNSVMSRATEQHDLFKAGMNIIEEDYPDFDDTDVKSGGYDSYFALVCKRDAELSHILSTGEVGLTKAGPRCGLLTNPFGGLYNSDTAATKMFGPTWDELLDDDAVQFVTIHGRSYTIVDSSNRTASKFISALRPKDRSDYRWRTPDSVSSKGHYYLINNLTIDGAQRCIIEDFYMGEHMDHTKYLYLDQGSSQPEQIDLLTNEVTKVEQPARLKTFDSELKTVGLSDLEAAEQAREKAWLNRGANVPTQILTIENEQPTYILAVSKDERKFMDIYHDALKAGELDTLESFGDWLSLHQEEGTIKPRVLDMFDRILLKATNEMLNYYLGLQGVQIEDSFLSEYQGIVDYLEGDDAPAHVKLLFVHGQKEHISDHLATLVGAGTAAYRAHFERVTGHAVVSAVAGERKRDKCLDVQTGKGSSVQMETSLHVITSKSKVYVLPQTISQIGLNPYDGEVVLSLDELPAKFVERLREDKALNLRQVLVTKDNYVLNVTINTGQYTDDKLSLVL